MKIAVTLCLLIGLWSQSVIAASFPLPPEDSNIIGEIQTIEAQAEDTLVAIALQYGLGFWEMRHANPGVDPWLPGAGTRIVLPMQFILPNAPRQGVVVNLAEMRLYYYPSVKKGQAPVVMTFPVGIGRMEWNTPLGTTRITSKVKNPTWYPPESVRAEHAAEGDPLPKVVPPGPDNPLGDFAMRLDLPGYLIHGTNKPSGVGMRVSHGCIRMQPEDIEALFKLVPVGTPVRIVNQPYKTGWLNNELYLEAHAAPEEIEKARNLTAAVEQVITATKTKTDYVVDWIRVQHTAQEARGLPEQVTVTAEAAADVLANSPTKTDRSLARRTLSHYKIKP